MKKNRLRVIQISGFRGILSAIFIVTCLIAGFVGFPAYVLANLWNRFFTALPQIGMFQGLILWGILAVSYAILNRKGKYIMAFEPRTVQPNELKDIIREIKAQKLKEAQEIKIHEQPEKQKQEDEEEKTKEVI
mgnify:CR=1 FL=1